VWLSPDGHKVGSTPTWGAPLNEEIVRRKAMQKAYWVRASCEWLLEVDEDDPRDVDEIAYDELKTAWGEQVADGLQYEVVGEG